jgi:hypothetical protein
MTNELRQKFEALCWNERADLLDSKGGAVHAEFFVIRNVALDGLAVTEGSLVLIEPHNVFEIVDRLTPSARYAMKAFGLPGL